MRSSVLSALVLSLAFVACQTQADSADQAATDAADEIRQLDARWVAMIEEGDVDGIVDLYTENGRIMPPGSESAVGPEALRAVWSEVVQIPSVTFGPDTIVVSESGEMAYDMGWVEMEAPGPDGELQTARGKYVVIWEKRNGEWKVATDIFNMNASGA